MMDNKFVIALGASSGGIDALSEFFDYTWPDGVSYIITIHLHPKYKSYLTGIIQRRSKLTVYTVEDNMKIESNIVYVMPENKTMTIKDGHLILTPRDLSIKINMAINAFFISLSEDTMYQKIAIVLSGMGEDGTEGIIALSKNGGYIIAQSSSSARQSSMPNSVINSGYVDEILDPKAMPAAIMAYVAKFSSETLDNDKAEDSAI